MNLLPLTNVPDIEPNFNAPWLDGLQTIVSYVLATGLVIMFLLLIFAILALAFGGIFPDRARDWAGKNIVVVFIATAALGAISGLFGWFINFDFGF